MAQYTDKDRIIALAGVFQAAKMAGDIARHGICDAAAFTASRETLFAFEPESVAAVFGGERGVLDGLQVLASQLERPQNRDLELSRYAIGVIHLADRLRRDDDRMQALYDDLSALQRRRQHIELTDDIVNGQLAQIYQDRISPMGPRIMVRGEPLHLQNPENASRIRVALLAGVRAAVLWRQAGGSKWRLLLHRRTIITASRELIGAIRH